MFFPKYLLLLSRDDISMVTYKLQHPMRFKLLNNEAFAEFSKLPDLFTTKRFCHVNVKNHHL